MWQKTTALPVKNEKEWRTVVHAKQNNEGELLIQWNPEVFATPNTVEFILLMLEQSAREAQTELEHASVAA